MKTAIVLSGGGSKGAYEIGVWKALEKIHITYDIVTGTSVGALNGAFMVQRNLEEAEEMWKHINFNKVFEDFTANYHTWDGKLKILKHYAQGILFEGGTNVSELEKTISQYINLDKFYNSPIDYGLVTVDLTDLKPCELSKLAIPRHLLCDYLMASATCFPAFQKKKIGNKYFIDGGYYDNLPIDFAIRLGAEKVIAVNIGSSHVIKSAFSKKVEVIVIEPHNNLGSFLVFDQALSKRAFALGYNDTMKTFKKLDGRIFTFSSGQIQKMTKKYYRKIVQKLDKLLSPLASIKKEYQQWITASSPLQEQLFLEMIERLGNLFNLEETTIYKEKTFHQQLKKSLSKEKNTPLDHITMIEEMKKFSQNKYLVVYLYQQLGKNLSPQEENWMKILCQTFPKQFLEAVYLTLLK